MDLLGMTLKELSAQLSSPSRARTLIKWIWDSGQPLAQLPSHIPGINYLAWNKLKVQCQWRHPTLLNRLVSTDGTIKYLFESQGATYETVLIPGRGRSTLCVSSQAGCSRKCSFCATGQLGLQRNLEASEIVGQLLATMQDAPQDAPLRNVVFMGMGEPMDNLPAVLRAIDILQQSPAPQISKNHITVSTCGILRGLSCFFKECSAAMAISLHATTDEQRNQLMPHNNRESLAELLGLLRNESQRSGRMFFFEYILFAGINDSLEDAQRLLAMLQGINARVNLILHNSFTLSRFRASSPDRVDVFQKILHQGGVRCLFRIPRGQEIGAACGQLAGQALNNNFENLS
jgi:23S rRNA (adenine2503-C2)-methyltransferase